MQTILLILYYAMQYYQYALLIYILMSWVPNLYHSKFGRVLSAICEPYLEPFRKIIPSFGGFDFSPIFALILLRLARSGVATLIIN